MMKKFILSMLSVLMIASVAYAQPKLEIIGGNSYDWGKVGPKDSPLKTKVKIKNTGNEQLLITNVKPSCGCTTAPLDKDKLAPGETATIDVSFNVGSNAGVNSKTIRITSNDPANSTTIFRLSADVEKAVVVSPAYFAFNQMEVGKEESSKISIKNTGKKPLTISNITKSPADLKLNLSGTKTLKPGESFDLVAKVTPTAPGYMNCWVKMKTDSVDEPEISISGYGSVKESPIFNNK
ncbi:MAG: hypothetical protein CVV25_12780 [Ignavibacteriae bacterium HGW-Ignavibacteriae-4]|jgi:uncharacterized membrane protein|nr:MAG: hypothetical protein CVV25_12780 [Ignavibacteriae bacterium HGW-Ignavibacteriae-4]